MLDEEKKAIKEVKHFNQLTRYWQEEEYEEKEIAGYITIILNLIEKQSKEIEEYKKQLDLDYVDKHFVPIERYNQLEKEIEELKKPKYVINCKTNEITKLTNDFVSKDKIKAKIAELIKEGNYRTADNPNGRVHFQKEITDYQIEVLQSLLEKE